MTAKKTKPQAETYRVSYRGATHANFGEMSWPLPQQSEEFWDRTWTGDVTAVPKELRGVINTMRSIASAYEALIMSKTVKEREKIVRTLRAAQKMSEGKK